MTVSTFYPDAHVETDTVDGTVLRFDDPSLWADLRSGAGTSHADSSAIATPEVLSSTTTDRWRFITRAIFLFDTASIGGDIIDSATFEFTASAKDSEFGGSIGMVTSTPASEIDLVNADYGQLQAVKQATDLTIASINIDGSTYNVFTLNATGEGNINKTGITKFGARIVSDLANAEPTWASNKRDRVQIKTADTADIVADPKLVVTHTSTVQTLLPGGIVSLEAFGTLNLLFLQTLIPSAISGLEAFGSPQLNFKLEPSGLVSLEAFGGLTLAPGPVTLGPDGIASLEAFGSQGVFVGAIIIAPTSLTSLEAFGTAALSLFLSPAAIASLEAFGDSIVQLDQIVVQPVSIASLETFGTLALFPGAVSLLPDSIVSQEAFGAPSLAFVVTPTGLASLEAFGTSQLDLTVFPGGVSSAEAFGTTMLLLYLTPTGIASLEAHGEATLAVGAVTLQPDGIASAEAIGSLTLLMYLSPTGVVSAETFGTLQLNQFVSPAAITSLATFGIPAVGQIFKLSMVGIASSEAFGAHILLPIPSASVRVRRIVRVGSRPVLLVPVRVVTTIARKVRMV